MSKPSLCSAALFVAALLAPSLIPAQTLAPTPPMGWNSWDSYGLTIDEDQFKANATVLASIQQYGWKYAVIDEGWYMANPAGHTLEEKNYLWDANGILIPVSTRFPSAANGAGFKPLADWLHAQGLKFGIHIVRGIPRQVVAANLPIAGSSFHATDAADTTSPCGWDQGNWGCPGQRRRPGLLRFDDSPLRLLGPRFSQSRLHLRPSISPHRDSPDRRCHSQIRPSYRALALPRPNAGRACN
ncbi:MAG: hypothetical protein WDM87_11565 [Terracidiphilus sp.]